MKKNSLLLLLLIVLILLTGCSAKDTDPKSSVSSTLSTPLRQLVETVCPDAAQLAALNTDDLCDVTGIEAEDYTEAVYLQNTSLSGREILVIRAKDETKAKQISQLLDTYLERRRKETRDYAPDAYSLLSKAKVTTKHLTVALIAGEKAAEETSQLLAGE